MRTRVCRALGRHAERARDGDDRLGHLDVGA
jgi:hypothetical protein